MIIAVNEARRRCRVLFLSFFFPPVHAIAAVRTGNIAKQLDAFGWDITVVTPHPSLWKFTDAADPFAGMERPGMRMLYTGYRWRSLSNGNIKRTYERSLQFYLEAVPRRIARALGIDELAGWYPEVMRACAHLKPGDADIVLVSGGPFGAFPVAEQLAQQLQCPFVLDYRDFWTATPYGTKAWERARATGTEARMLQRAAAVTVISPSMGRFMAQRYKIDEKIRIVRNGYDSEEMAPVASHDFGHFAIVYTGQFFPPRRNPDPLMRALALLAQDETLPDWLFHYYGFQQDVVRHSAEAHRVGHKIVCHGVVPRQETLSAVRGAGAAVIITSVEDDGSTLDQAVIPGKLYEPIGLGTNIVLICPHGSDAEEVINIAGGGKAFRGGDAGGIAEFLAHLMRGGSVVRKHPEAYSWQNLGGQMDALLRTVLERRMASQEEKVRHGIVF